MSDNIVEVAISDLLTTDNMVIDIMMAAQQGPSGPPGPTTISLLSNTSLISNKVVKFTANGCSYANNLIASDVNRVVGFTTTSSIPGGYNTIQFARELSGFTNLIPGELVYLGNSGDIQQTIPNSGYVLKMGIATSNTKILISIGQPV